MTSSPPIPSAADPQTRWMPLTARQRTVVEWVEVPEFIGITTDLLLLSPYITRESQHVRMVFENGTLVWYVHRDDLDFGREMALELVEVLI